MKNQKLNQPIKQPRSASPKQRFPLPPPPPPRRLKSTEDNKSHESKAEAKSIVLKPPTLTIHPPGSLKRPIPPIQPESLNTPERFDSMKTDSFDSPDQVMLNLDQNIPSRRKSTLIDIAVDTVQTAVNYFNQPYKPSPALLAFLQSLYLTEEELKAIPMQELDQLINQNWYGRFLNGFASNHVFFKIFAFWYLDESGIKLHELCAPSNSEAIDLETITAWDKNVEIENKELKVNGKHKKDKKSEQAEFSEALIQQNTKNYFASRVWPKNRCLLFESQTILSQAYSIEEMTNQLRWFNKIWALLLLSLLSNDIYFYYAYPERRYDNTLTQILLSRSKHSKMLSRSLMSITVWPELVALPLILAAYGAIWKRYYPTRSIPTEAIDSIQQYWQNYNPTWKQDLFYPFITLLIPGFLSKRFGLHPFPDKRYNFNNVAKTILWDGQVPPEDKMRLFEITKTFLNHATKLNKINLLVLFEEFAENIHPLDIQRLKKAGYSKETVKTLLHIQSEALVILKAQSKWNAHNFIYALYAHFLLWNIGQPETTLLQPFFWAFQSYRWYATINFFVILVTGLQKMIETYLAKKACEKADKLWIYMDQAADYQCTVCGDLPIYYGHVFSHADCITQWFEGKMRTAQELIDFAENRLGRVDFSYMTVLNFEKQYINDKDLKLFLQVLEARAINLDTLNLKMTRSPAAQWVPLNITAMQALTHFIQVVPIKNLNLQSQFLGNEEIQVLSQGLNSSHLHTLDLTSNVIGDEGATALGLGLPGSSLQTLDLSRNENIGAMGVAGLSVGLVKSNLQTLSLSQTNIGDIGAQELGLCLANAKLRALDLSQNNITDFGAEKLSLELAASQLEDLSLAGNSITDIGAEKIGLALCHSSLLTLNLRDNIILTYGAAGLGLYLNRSNLKMLILKHNDMRDEGAIGLGAGLPGSPLQTLDLSYNNIYDGGIIGLAAGLPGSSLQSLDLSSNIFNDEGFNALANKLSNSKLQVLNVKDNNINNVSSLIETLSASNLQTLDLSQNIIDDVGAEQLGLSLNGSTLRTLILANNKIGRAGAKGIGLGLSSSNLQSLDLSSNKLNADGTEELSLYLNQSASLRTLFLNLNNISDAGANSLASRLCGSNLQELYLRGNNIGAPGATGLGEGLPNSNLRLLRLSGNILIGETGAVALLERLPESKLEILDLDQAKIGDTGAIALGTKLTNSNLLQLSLERNDIQAAGAIGLSAGLPNAKLEQLILNKNNIGDIGAIAIADILTNIPYQIPNTMWIQQLDPDIKRGLSQSQPNTNLKVLDLSSNQFTDIGAETLCRVLPYSGIPLSDLFIRANNIEDDNLEQHCKISAASYLQLPMPFRLVKNLYRFIEKNIWSVQSAPQVILTENIYYGNNREMWFDHRDYSGLLDISIHSPDFLSTNRLSDSNYRNALPLSQTQNNTYNDILPSLMMYFILGMLLWWMYKKLFVSEHKNDIILEKKCTQKSLKNNPNNFWASKPVISETQITNKVLKNALPN